LLVAAQVEQVRPVAVAVEVYIIVQIGPLQ
jgi:hypothetical protein